MGKLGVTKAVAAGGTLNIGGVGIEDLKTEIASLKAKAIEWVDPKTISIREPFKSIWPIDPTIKREVTESMREHGYDHTQPVIVWGSPKGLVLLDGHTRRESAIEAEIPLIPYTIQNFESEAEAYAYATLLQINRRNLTDAQLLHFIQSNAGKELPGKGKRAERLARLFDISESTAKRALNVAAKADPKDLKAIAKGKKTINAVNQEIVQGKMESISGVQKNPPQQLAISDSDTSNKVVLSESGIAKTSVPEQPEKPADKALPRGFGEAARAIRKEIQGKDPSLAAGVKLALKMLEIYQVISHAEHIDMLNAIEQEELFQ